MTTPKLRPASMFTLDDKAIVRYGRFRHPCTVIQILGQGKYVKVALDSNGSIFVFTQTQQGKYSRKSPGGGFYWFLDRVEADTRGTLRNHIGRIMDAWVTRSSV